MAFPHADAIEASLAAAATRAGDLTPLVYERLFANRPETRAEFWRDTRGAIKGEMLARLFETILDLIGPRAYADHMIASEIVTHDAYGIPRDVFASFFGIVAQTVEDAAGPDWTRDMEGAWVALLGEIAAIIAAMPAPDAPGRVLDPAAILPSNAGGIPFPHR
jgi:hypothetical protein